MFILKPMEPYTLTFEEVEGTRLHEVGGKGANLGELTRAGFPVPPGFCVTTAAYLDFVRTSTDLDALLDALDRVTHEDLRTIGTLGARICEHLEALPVPTECFRARFTDNVNSSTELYWAWGTSGRWTAPDYPRFEYGSEPLLLKIYVSRNVTPPGGPNTTERFLNDFLPELKATIDPATP
jgi:pyruvate,water dikinase